MATTNYSLRIDEADKQKAEQVFKALGMTFSTGINIYIKAVGRMQQIPFSLSLNESAVSSYGTIISQDDKENSFNALNAILEGHDINPEQEREERIISK